VVLGLIFLSAWFSYKKDRAKADIDDAFKDRWIRKYQLFAFYMWSLIENCGILNRSAGNLTDARSQVSDGRPV